MTLTEAVKILKKGGVVAYPTETFYGLGVDPRNPKAIEKIFQIKKRDKGKPISLILASSRYLKDWVKTVGQREKKAIKEFWPGPLTIVFKAKPSVPKSLTAGTHTIAIRVSSEPIAKTLAQKLGGAITATSANQSGFKPALNSESAKKIGIMLDGVVSNKILLKNKGSTILSIYNNSINVIREGMIPIKKIEKILWPIQK